MNNMEKRFDSIWRSLGVVPLNVKSIPLEFQRLSRSYSEPHRFYHNLDHIKNCLDELYSMGLNRINDPPNELWDLRPLELAIWYHDVIYDTKPPQSLNNEELSAQFLSRTYSVLKPHPMFTRPYPLLRKVCRLINDTKHLSIPRDLSGKTIVDIDLSIFGQSNETFDKYDKNIRKEYSHVSENDFKKGRKKILEGFLERDSIYLTDFFREKYEYRARKNLRRSISKL